MDTCTQCQHRGNDVDVGVCFFCAHNTSRELAVFGHLMLKALGRHAPIKNAEKKAEAKADGRAKLYPAKPDDLGLSTPRDVYNALLEPRFEELVKTKRGFDELAVALAIVRGAAFKAEEPWTYGVADVVDIRAMVGAYSPAQIARAIVAASKDSFWSTKGAIKFRSLRENMPALLSARTAAAGTASKERRAQVLALIKERIATLKTLSPLDAAEHEDRDLTRLDVETLASFAETIKGEIAKWTKW
jgi:hypothetical protein